MNRTIEHQKLVDDILFKIGSLPNVRLWTRSVGVANPIGSERIIRFGIPGESDLQGILKPSGRYISIEVKTGSAKLSKAQKNWRNMILSFGGIYVEARSVEEALYAIENAS